MAALGVLLVLCAGAYLVDVAVTNSVASHLDFFGTTLSLTTGRGFLLGAAAGFVLALGLAMLTTGLSRRGRRRRQHRMALAQQRAETERLAAELERERTARLSTQSEDTAVVYPHEPATPADDPLRQR
jgi:hypothetical protein